jgi:hypothetical protein
MTDWTLVDGEWHHAPRWKVAINSILRAFQPGPRKLLVYTRAAISPGAGQPLTLGYGVGWILHT